jgi:hypothetical protein
MIAPHRSIPEPDLLPELRDLLNEYPSLKFRDAETVRRMLRMSRGLAVSEFEASVALEPLRDESGEVLA